MKHLRITLLLLVLLSTAFVLSAQSDFDWRRYEGSEIRVLVIQGPWIDSVRHHIPEFEAATGITVNLETLPEAQAWDKMRVELQAQSRDLDVMLYQTSQQGLDFSTNGWVVPLDDWLADPSMTNPDFNWETDFLVDGRNAMVFNGQTIAVPTDRTLGPMLAYRRDILEEYGVEVPTTLEELAEAARFIWEASGNTIPGIVYRGQGTSATSHFAHVMHEFGARWEDADGNPLLNTPEMIAAFEWYGRTLREAGSIGATAFEFSQTVNEFLSGNAAFTLELGINPSNVANPAVSNVAGLVGFTVIPRGPGPEEARYTEPCVPVRPFALSISSFSQNQEASWYFIQWMTGFEPQLSYLQAGRVAARSSPWESAEFEESLSEDAREYWAAQAISSGFCYPTRGHAPPSIRDSGRAREIIGQVIETSILGGDVTAAANQAQEELEALVARERR